MAGPTPVSCADPRRDDGRRRCLLRGPALPRLRWPPGRAAVLAVMAAITMVGSGLAALAQHDIKRVLAYSTIGQLGYMLGALGRRRPRRRRLPPHLARRVQGAPLPRGGRDHPRRRHQLAGRHVPDERPARRRVPDAFWTMTVGRSRSPRSRRSAASSPRKPSSAPPSTRPPADAEHRPPARPVGSSSSRTAHRLPHRRLRHPPVAAGLQRPGGRGPRPWPTAADHDPCWGAPPPDPRASASPDPRPPRLVRRP